MTTCSYKKTFLKDLANLPLVYRERIEKLTFEEIPELDNIFGSLDIKKDARIQGLLSDKGGQL